MRRLTVENSPQLYARIAGVLYLINILCGMWGELFVRGRLVVAGDAVATAHRIIGSELLFRSGVAGDLVMHITDVPMIVIFYVLLRPVNRDLSLLAACLNLVQTSVLVLNKLNLIAVLLLLSGAKYLNSFTSQQLQSLGYFYLSLHEYGFAIGLVFFAVTCFVTAYLIYRSGFLPRTIGVLQGVAGLCYLVNSFVMILSPAFAEKLVPAILAPAFIGELLTCLWFLVMGVNVKKWDERLRMNAAESRG